MFGSGVSVWLEGMGGMERNKNKEVRGFKEIGAKELLHNVRKLKANARSNHIVSCIISTEDEKVYLILVTLPLLTWASSW